MNSKVILGTMLLAFFFSFSMLPSAFSLTDEEATKLVKDIDQTIYPLECRIMGEMKNFQGEGRQTENRMEVLRKDDMLLAIFLSPPIQKEQKFLRNGDNMWTYLPRSKRVMRISAKERSMGGEANNSDVMRVDLVKDYIVKYIGDESLDSTTCYKLELLGKERKVAYKKIIYWISKDQKLPVKRELYSISGRLMKNMYFEDVKKINGVDRPTKWIIENVIDPTYRTEFLFLEIDEEARFRNTMFTPAYLKHM